MGGNLKMSFFVFGYTPFLDFSVVEFLDLEYLRTVLTNSMTTFTFIMIIIIMTFVGSPACSCKLLIQQPLKIRLCSAGLSPNVDTYLCFVDVTTSLRNSNLKIVPGFRLQWNYNRYVEPNVIISDDEEKRGYYLNRLHFIR